MKGTFLERVKALPFLGIGVSTEFGAFRADGALNLSELHRRYPQFARFLEVGVEVVKGLDDDARNWAQGATYDLPFSRHQSR